MRKTITVREALTPIVNQSIARMNWPGVPESSKLAGLLIYGALIFNHLHQHGIDMVTFLDYLTSESGTRELQRLISKDTSPAAPRKTTPQAE